MENYKAIKEDTRKMENCKANNVPKKRFSQKLPGVFQGRWVFSETGRVDKDFIYSIWKSRREKIWVFFSWKLLKPHLKWET